ncbi:cAMP-dependent protein kinase catalytic subunit alpha-like [Galendromus occidentalis]|uniref:cAMP-dependent protein kinase catalytic subunit alpha-like n=1 Tax=Galendromus occidentalis TaxID=34638 RepID=A0AAJ6QXI7_9ACAR|nr:cAMP-dependent protein kinase catalytic subunit alpha-like [Galendromus occidentalis]
MFEYLSYDFWFGPKLIKTRSEYKEYLAKQKEEFNKRLTNEKCPETRLKKFEFTGFIHTTLFGSLVEARRRKKDRKFFVRIEEKFEIVYQMGKLEWQMSMAQVKKIHRAVRSNFIAHLLYTIQDSKNLYLLTEHAPYGSLLHAMASNQDYFSEDDIKFCAAQIVLAFEYLHTCEILYRALSLKSVFIFADGYIKLCDFTAAKQTTKTTRSDVGIGGYRPPEVFGNRWYYTGFDWWSLGILIFHLYYEDFPFDLKGDDYDHDKRAIFKNPLEFYDEERGSTQSCDLLTGLLQKDQNNRLGVWGTGVLEVKKHPWFRDVDFLRIFSKRIRSPLKLVPLKTEPIDDLSSLIPTKEIDDKYLSRFRDF